MTYRNLGVEPLSPVCPRYFAQLDLLLAPQACLLSVSDVRSYRDEALASQHFLVVARVAGYGLGQILNTGAKKKMDRSLLKEASVATVFNDTFQRSLETQVRGDDVNQLCISVANAFDAAAECLQVESVRQSRRPWITKATIEMVEARALARRDGNYDEEKRLHKLVRQSARRDRRAWLSDLAGTGAWKNLRRIRKRRSA